MCADFSEGCCGSSAAEAGGCREKLTVCSRSRRSAKALNPLHFRVRGYTGTSKMRVLRRHGVRREALGHLV